MTLCMKNKKERRLQMAKKLTTQKEIIYKLTLTVKFLVEKLEKEMNTTDHLLRILEMKSFKQIKDL